ncbi:MAG TPA: hypothetical protein VGB42_11160 [Candidatus Thermoplasmatota archaeon]
MAGFDVALVVRNRERGEAAISEIRAPAPHAALGLLLADLASQRSVREDAADWS